MVKLCLSDKKVFILTIFIFTFLTFIFFAGATAVHAKNKISGEFLLFPHASVLYQSVDEENEDSKKTDSEAGVDFFFSAEYGYLMALGEVMISTEETEIERLQLGLSLRPGANVWAGRYHNPIGFWNLQFHHGSYLQTTISRPGIVEYIDDGGILPMHIFGILAELSPTEGGAGISIQASVGAGPSIDFAYDHVLEEWDMLDPKEEAHGLSYAVRLSYRPHDFKPDEFGVFYSKSHIKREGEPSPYPFVEINQSIYGLFSHFGAGSVTITGAFFFVENDIPLSGAGREVDSFTSGYIQIESIWHSDWTFYFRGEGLQSGGDDLYLSLFPDFTRERILGGVRYDITKRQALKLEISNVLRMNERFDNAVIQWSAAFP